MKNIDEQLNKIFPRDRAIRKTIRELATKANQGKPPMRTPWTLLDSLNKKLYTAPAHSACFGQLPIQVSTYLNKDVKYLNYKPHYVELTAPLSDQELLRWYRLGIDLGVLGDDNTPENVLECGIKVDISDSNLSVAKLYLMLNFIRWTREASTLVRETINLVDNHGKDFWASVVYCHYRFCGYVDHSIIPFEGDYGGGSHLARDIGLVRKLYKITKEPLKVDPRVFIVYVAKCFIEKKANFNWNWHGKTVKPENSLLVKNREMLLSGEVLPVINATSEEEALEIVAFLKGKSKHVQFSENTRCK